MTKREIKRLLILSIPYVVFGLVSTNLGEAWRMAKVSVPNSPILGMMGALPAAFGNLAPSFQPFDLCVGVICGVGLRLAVYLKGKNAKKHRHNTDNRMKKAPSQKVRTQKMMKKRGMPDEESVQACQLQLGAIQQIRMEER